MKRIYLGFIILALAVAVANNGFSKGWKTDESEKYLKWWDRTYQGTDSAILGGVMYQKGDYKAAINELETSIKSGSGDGRVYYQLAFAYQQEGNIDKAIESYKKAIELLDKQDIKHRYDYYAYYNLALIYKDRGEIDESITIVTEALKKHKEPSGYNLLGWLYWKKGERDKALGEYKRSIKIDANQEDAQYNLGVLYYNNGDVKHAQKAFEKVKELNPDHKKTLVYLGNLGDEAVLGKIEYQDLIIPEPALRYCYKGKQYLDENKITEAEHEYETAYELAPFSPIVNQGLGVVYEYNDKGIRYGKGFNIKKGIFHYNKALVSDPDLIEAVFNLAVLYSINGSTNNAIRLYRRVIRLQPDDAEAQYNIAVLYDNETDDYKRARYHYVRYLDLVPNSPKKVAVKKRLRELEQ